MYLHPDIANELVAMVDGVPFGAASWNDVVAAVASALPGSFAAIQNANFAASQLNSIYSHNIPTDFLEAYRVHFAAINPWEKYWFNVPTGTVVSSEEVAPSSLFKHTEFYNDWLMPQSGIAAAGLKIAADRGETIRMYLNYPMDRSSSYDAAAVRLMKQLRGSLERTMNLLRAMRDSSEIAIGRAALVARGNRAAFVVGAGCVLDEANDSAEALFRLGTALKVRGRVVTLSQPSAHAQFSEAVSRLCRGQTVELSRIALETDAGRWLVSIAAIGTGASYEFSGLLPLRRKVFVTITPISGEQLPFVDGATTRRLFGLTTTEHELCLQLMHGGTLSEIADATGVSKETVRSRLKAVFVKTNLTRQADVILLFSRISH